MRTSYRISSGMSGSLLRDFLLPLAPADFGRAFPGNGLEVFLRRRFAGGSGLVSCSEPSTRRTTRFGVLSFCRRREERRSGPAAEDDIVGVGGGCVRDETGVAWQVEDDVVWIRGRWPEQRSLQGREGAASARPLRGHSGRP